MSDTPGARGHGFGTMPVFLAGLSTILGAVMFLRFGYAVGNVGLAGALAIIVLGHLVTIPTALALSEIATNRKVEGGGEYFIISRTFGVRIGAAIGSSLYLSQAFSVAFYVIAFGEAASVLAPYFTELTGYAFDPRFVSIPTALVLGAIMIFNGAGTGVKVLYGVVAVLLVSLGTFFLGSPVEPADGSFEWFQRIDDPDAFFVVFAIVFPSFTGMTAGVGLSGDLAEPRKAIPLGVIGATLAGMLVYVAMAFKLDAAASPELLAHDQMVMAKIAPWGPIIPIGLACATLSSAVGSLLVAPRTLQALAKDGCFAPASVNDALARGRGSANEPRAATALTLVVTLAVVAVGSVDLVARLISMFFMVTYGALCTISFLEHFAGNPDYRPSFNTRWYISLLGALMCAALMFLMDPVFAAASVLAMVAFYGLTRFTRAGQSRETIVAVFLGVMAQVTRWIHVRLQRGHWADSPRSWRPNVVAFNPGTLTEGHAMTRMLRWLSAEHGVGTYVQLLEGRLDSNTHGEALKLRERIIDMTRAEMPRVFVTTMVSPSLREAMAQVLQMPGVAGVENNSVLLDVSERGDRQLRRAIVEDARLAAATGHNVLMLREDGTRFGERKRVDVWLTRHDGHNAELMLLLAFIIAGHPDWTGTELRVRAALPAQAAADERGALERLVAEGRLPIREQGIEFLTTEDRPDFELKVAEASADADLVILGLSEGQLEHEGVYERLAAHSEIGHVLFVHARENVCLR